MSTLNTYVDMLNKAYRNGTNNHLEHNSNPNYWDVLLGDIKFNPDNWKDKVGLDFGCGQGRNVSNLLRMSEWQRVDGVDVSAANIETCKNTPDLINSNFYNNNGKDLAELKDNEYDFVMSTIVFQHICVHELRYKLKEEIYRVLKKGGLFSFQMGFGDIGFTGHTRPNNYHANSYNAEDSNGSNDVRVTDEKELISDLESIGFKEITFEVLDSYLDGGHPSWIYVKCRK
jgi:SAM-dependent methyltransferase